MARAGSTKTGAVAGRGDTAKRAKNAETTEFSLGGLAGGYSDLITTSVPDEIPRHNISDEELDVLCDPARDELWELKWVALGAFVSTLPAAINGVFDYAKSPQHVMSILTLIQLAITLVALAVWLVLRFVVPRKKAKSNAKRDEIRARTRRIRETVSGTASR